MRDANALNTTYDHTSFVPSGFRHLRLRGTGMPRPPYVACVGGGGVYGRYVDHPWPELLASRIGVSTLNLGIGDGSPETFLDPRLLELINAADAVILTAMTARNSIEQWTPNVDGLKGCCTREGVTFSERWKLAIEQPEDLDAMIKTARENWVRHMRSVIGAIHRPIVFAWISQRWCDYQPHTRSVHGVWGHYPHLVNREMVDAVGIPAVKIVRPFGGYYPDQAAHGAIAEAIGRAFRRDLGHEAPEKTLLDCIYRGPEKPNVRCSECVSPIFQCKKHGVCIIEPVAKMSQKACSTCDDRKESQ